GVGGLGAVRGFGPGAAAAAGVTTGALTSGGLALGKAGPPRTGGRPGVVLTGIRPDRGGVPVGGP
ncbi:MAG: hypothetical protein ACRDZY_13700, partial [Acidimicrobiales bacterium]